MPRSASVEVWKTLRGNSLQEMLEDIGPRCLQNDWSIFTAAVMRSTDRLRISTAALSLPPPIKDDTALLFREMASTKDSLLAKDIVSFCGALWSGGRVKKVLRVF